jgi:hypothetical protein
MNDTGFNWSIATADDGWIWMLKDRDSAQILVAGRAPTRAVAAAMVVRAIARGMTAECSQRLAA